MKKEILPVLSLLLALAFPLSALAEHDPQKDMNQEEPDLVPPALAKAIAAPMLGTALPAAVSSDQAFSQFLGRWGDVCPEGGRKSKNSWQERYDEECNLVLRSTDKNVQADKPDLAGYDRGYKSAMGLYNLLSRGEWTKAHDFEKELGRRTVKMLPDYGTNVDPKLRVINLIYVYLGPDAVKNLIGPDGKGGKLDVVRRLEHPKDKPVTADEMNRYFDQKAQASMASTTKSKAQQKDSEKSSQALARLLEKGLQPVAGTDALAAATPPPGGVLAPPPSGGSAPSVVAAQKTAAAAPATSLFTPVTLDHDHSIASNLAGGHLKVDSFGNGMCTVAQSMDGKCKLGEVAPAAPLKFDPSGMCSVAQSMDGKCKLGGLAPCAAGDFHCQAERQRLAAAENVPSGPPPGPPADKIKPVVPSRPVVQGLVAQPKWGTVTEYKSSTASSLQKIAWDDGTQLVSSKPIDPSGNSYGFSAGSVVEFTKGSEDWRFSVSGGGFSINKQPAPTVDQIRGNTSNVKARRISKAPSSAIGEASWVGPHIEGGAMQPGVWKYSNGMILDPQKHQIYDPATRALGQCDADNANCKWVRQPIYYTKP
ncbi:MAG: hypothetical protein ACHQ2Z_13825 [Elusimicrobiota bacterium]